MKKVLALCCYALLAASAAMALTGFLSQEQIEEGKKRKADQDDQRARDMEDGLHRDVRDYLPKDAKELKDEPNGWVSFALDRNGKVGHYMARCWYGSHNEKGLTVVRTD